MKLLGIDIGASGGKAVLGDFTDGRLELSEVRRFPNRMIDIHGHRHWDILRLFEDVKECIKAAPYVDGIGLDTWAVDYGYVGHDGDLLGMPFAYRDSRTETSIPVVHEKISSLLLYETTGIQFLPFNTIYQVAEDLISRPWLVDRADKLLMIPELLGYLLTNVKASEYTNASTTSMLDITSKSWSLEILDRIGFPHDRLPEPIPPGGAKVELSAGVESETNCSALFTYVACHDTASAVAGIPAFRDGNWAFISSGTWSLVGMEIDKPIVSDAARDANFTNEGGVDGTIRFLTNVTGLWLQNQLQKAWVREGRGGEEKRGGSGVSFETIRREVEKAPPFRSIINPDDPSFTAPDDMRIAIREYCRSTNQTIPNGIGPFMRCIFESLVLAYKRRILQLEELTGVEIDRIHVVGGGSRDSLLCQMTSDACGKMVIAGPSDATASGNLIVQAIAHGLVGNLAEGRELLARTFSPTEYTPSRTDLWEPAYHKFEQLIQSPRN